jgi:hypothetical protein
MLTDEQKRLNRAIAERKGWRVLLDDHAPFLEGGEGLYDEPFWTNKPGYMLIQPNGETYSDEGNDTEDDAWLEAPDWAGDLNLAWELLNTPPFRDSAVAYGLAIRIYTMQPTDAAHMIAEWWLDWYDRTQN